MKANANSTGTAPMALLAPAKAKMIHSAIANEETIETISQPARVRSLTSVCGSVTVISVQPRRAAVDSAPRIQLDFPAIAESSVLPGRLNGPHRRVRRGCLRPALESQNCSRATHL